MSQRFDLTLRDGGGACVLTTRDVSVGSVRLRERIVRIEVLIDQRRVLPHIVRAVGDGFEMTVATDNSRRARRFAYDLAGW